MQTSGFDEAPLRHAILTAGRSLDDPRSLRRCADLLREAAWEAPAQALEALGALREGFSAEAVWRRAVCAERVGRDRDADIPTCRPAGETPAEAAWRDVRAVMDQQPALSRVATFDGRASREALRSTAPSEGALTPDRLPALGDPLEALRGALGREGDNDALAAVSASLGALRTLALDPAPFDLAHGDARVTELAWRLVSESTRTWLLDVYDLAFPPFGSAAVLHIAARSPGSGLGPYAGHVQRLLRNGRELLGLVQLADGRPLDRHVDAETLARLPAFLASQTSGGLRLDILHELADVGLLPALWAILTLGLRRTGRPMERGLLQTLRDAGMDLGDLDLAWTAQHHLAQTWSDDEHEWLALADISAYRGEFQTAEELFTRALQLDPDNGHAARCLSALRAGDHGGFVNRGGFGTPDDRRRNRAEFLQGRLDQPLDFTQEARSLDFADSALNLVADLSPDPARSEAEPAEGLHLRHLGTRRKPSSWGDLPQLRGVEAVRGFLIGREPIVEVEAVLEGRVLARGVPSLHPAPPRSQDWRKAVFNLWVDVSDCPRGLHEIELRWTDGSGHVSGHRERVIVTAPLTEADHPSSDALVEAFERSSGTLEDDVNSRPSMVRPARRTLFDTPERVLVLRVDQLGDLICSIPALKRLREILPGAELTGLVSPANAALARSLNVFDDLILVDFKTDPVERRRVMDLDRQRELRADLHARRFDLAIDLADNSPSRYLLLLSGAKRLFGVQGDRYGFLDLDFQSHSRDPVNGSEALPATNKMLAMIEWLGVALRSCGQTIRRDDLSAALLTRYGVEPGRYAVLHTGAQLKFSRWPHFPALAAALLRATDLQVVLISDEPMSAAELGPELVGHPRLKLVEGQLPFDELDALLSYCAVFVGNDSGPKHLASLRGSQVVSLHCARNNWNEWGQENTGRIISRRVPCAGCQISQHPEECGRDIACLRLIRPDEVLDAALDLLGSEASV